MRKFQDSGNKFLILQEKVDFLIKIFQVEAKAATEPYVKPQ